MVEWAKLTVSEDFKEKIREFDGANDQERLKNWAKSFEGSKKAEEFDLYDYEEELEDIIEEKVEELRRQY